MPLTQREAELRAIARERCARGGLPSVPPARMWVGHGSGKLCSLCDNVIQPQDVEYEYEVQDDLGAAARTCFFHLVCESIWRLECGRRDYLTKHRGHVP